MSALKEIVREKKILPVRFSGWVSANLTDVRHINMIKTHIFINIYMGGSSQKRSETQRSRWTWQLICPFNRGKRVWASGDNTF